MWYNLKSETKATLIILLIILFLATIPISVILKVFFYIIMATLLGILWIVFKLSFDKQ